MSLLRFNLYLFFSNVFYFTNVVKVEYRYLQELIRRWDSERELLRRHRTCTRQRLHPWTDFL